MKNNVSAKKKKKKVVTPVSLVLKDCEVLPNTRTGRVRGSWSKGDEDIVDFYLQRKHDGANAYKRRMKERTKCDLQNIRETGVLLLRKWNCQGLVFILCQENRRRH